MTLHIWRPSLCPYQALLKKPRGNLTTCHALLLLALRGTSPRPRPTAAVAAAAFLGRGASGCRRRGRGPGPRTGTGGHAATAAGVHCHAARELVHAAHMIFCATRTLIHATRILVHAAAHARHTDSGGGGGVASSYESLVVHPARVVTYSFARHTHSFTWHTYSFTRYTYSFTRRTRSFTRTDPGGGSTFFAFSLSLAPPVEGRANGLCTIMHNIIRLRRFLSRPRGTTLAPAPWRGPRHTARSLKPTAELPRSHTPPRLSRPAWVSAPGRLAPASH